jgi:hypothetical protein
MCSILKLHKKSSTFVASEDILDKLRQMDLNTQREKEETFIDLTTSHHTNARVMSQEEEQTPFLLVSEEEEIEPNYPYYDSDEEEIFYSAEEC